ncbi:oligosaccharide flippase family protein, partial [Bacillus velezensis]|uniref:oligosaccharide flippase family protein n=1 Tax=Bacillus velezensis TaxID=492670 RepID=UPI0021B5725F
MSSFYSLNIITPLALFPLLFFTTPLIPHFYPPHDLLYLIPLLPLIFLIPPIPHQYHYILQKPLPFNTLTNIQIFSNLLSFLY